MNVALAKAIIDSGKKKKTVARLARIEPWELSRMLHGNKAPSETQGARLAKVLGRSTAELFDQVSA